MIPVDTLRENLAHAVKAMRAESGIPTGQFVRLAKISQAALWNLENSPSTSVNLITLQSVAGALGVRLSTLLEAAEKWTPGTPQKLPEVRRGKPEIHTASQLKFRVESAGHSALFFCRENMRFSGDKMSNYGVRQPVEIYTVSGNSVLAYELYRKRPVKHQMKASAWFCAETFRRVYKSETAVEPSTQPKLPRHCRRHGRSVD